MNLLKLILIKCLLLNHINRFNSAIIEQLNAHLKKGGFADNYSRKPEEWPRCDSASRLNVH